MSESMKRATPEREGLRGAKWWVAGLIVAVSGTVGLSAYARADHMGGAMMGGPGMMGGAAFMGRGVDRMLDGLGVSDAQRSQIQQIVQAASTEMRAQHEAGRALRDKGMQLLTAPTIDATAAEALRQQMQVQHDQASKRMLQTLIDVARVLTPEQRTKLGERMKLRRDAMQERMQRGAPRVTEQKG